MKAEDREKLIYEKYGIVILKKDTKMEVGKMYYMGTIRQFEDYVKSIIII